MRYQIHRILELFGHAAGYLLIREDDNYCYIDVEAYLDVDMIQSGFDEEGVDEMADVETAILSDAKEHPEYLETVDTLEECVGYMKTCELLES